MEKFNDLIANWCRALDKVAGFCIAGTVLLVVSNIIMRAVFNRPFLGTYEYVGFMMAIIIGFSLAYCAVQESHIAVDFITKRLPRDIKTVIGIVTEVISFGFLALVTWNLIKYAGSIYRTGQVSSTTEMPIYPFIYLVALGFFMLTVVSLTKSIKTVKSVVEK